MLRRQVATFVVGVLLAATATALSCAPGDVLEYVVTNTATHEGPSAPLVSATHRVTLTCGPRREQWHDVDVRVEAHQSPHGFSKDRHHAAHGSAVISTEAPFDVPSEPSAAWAKPSAPSTATYHAGILFNGSVAFVEARDKTTRNTASGVMEASSLVKRDLVMKLLQQLQPEDTSHTAALPHPMTQTADAAREFFAPGSVGEPLAHSEIRPPSTAEPTSVVLLHRMSSHRPVTSVERGASGTTGSTHSHAVRRDGTVARVHKVAHVRFHDGADEVKNGAPAADANPYLSQEIDAVLIRRTNARPPMVATAATAHGQLRMLYPPVVVLHSDSSFGLLFDDVVLSMEHEASTTPIHVALSCGAFEVEATEPLIKWQSAFTATLLTATRRATVPSTCTSITLTANAVGASGAPARATISVQPSSSEAAAAGAKAWATSYEPQFQCTSESGRGFPEGTTPAQAFELLVAELRNAASLADDSAFRTSANGGTTSISLRIASFLNCFPEHAAALSARLLLKPAAASQRSREICGWTASVLASMRHPTAAQAEFAKCLDGPCCLPLNDAVSVVARLPAITDAQLVDRVAALAKRDDVDTNAVAMVLREWKADKWTKAARFGRLFPKLFGKGGELDPRRDATARRSMHAEADQEMYPSAPFSQFRFSALMDGAHSSSLGAKTIRRSDTLGGSNYGLGGIVQTHVKSTFLFGAIGAYEYDLDIEGSAAYIQLYMLGESCSIAGGAVRYRWHQYRDVSPGDPLGSGPYCPSRYYAPNETAALTEGQNQNYDMAKEWGLFKPWIIASRGPDSVSEVPAADGVIQERTDTSCAAAFDLEIARTQHPETFSHATFDGLPNAALPPSILLCLARARRFYGSCDGDRGQYVLQLTNCLELAMNTIVAPVLQLDRGQELLDALAGFAGSVMRWRVATGRNSAAACKAYTDCIADPARSFCTREGDECLWNQLRLKRDDITNTGVVRRLMTGIFACPAGNAACAAAAYCTQGPKACARTLWDAMVRPFKPALESSACGTFTAQRLLAIGTAHFVMKHMQDLGFRLTHEFELVAQQRCGCVKRSLSTYLAQDDGYTSHYDMVSPQLKSAAIRGGAKPAHVTEVYGTTCKTVDEEQNSGFSLALIQIPIGVKFFVRRTISLHVAKSGATATRVPGEAPEVSATVTSQFDISGKFESGVGIEGEKNRQTASVSVTFHTDAKPIRGSSTLATTISMDSSQRVAGSSSFFPNARVAGTRKYVTIDLCAGNNCQGTEVKTLSSTPAEVGKYEDLWRDRRASPSNSPAPARPNAFMVAPVWTPRVAAASYVGGHPFVLCYARPNTGCPVTSSTLTFGRGDATVAGAPKTAGQDVGWLSPKAAVGAEVRCEHRINSCEPQKTKRYVTTAVYDPQSPMVVITRGSTVGTDDANVTSPEKRCFSLTVTAKGPAPVSDIVIYGRVPGLEAHATPTALVSTTAAASGTTHCFYVSYPITYAYVIATSAAGAVTRTASKPIIVDTTPLALKQYTVGCGGDAVTLPAGGQASAVWVKSGAVCVSFDVSVPESGVAGSAVFLENSAGERLGSTVMPISSAGTASGAVNVTADGRYRFVLVVTKADTTTVDLPTALFGLDSSGPAATTVWFVNKATGVRTSTVGPTEDVCLEWPQGGFYDASGLTAITASVACASGATASAALPAGDLGTASRLCVGVMAAVVSGERCTGNVTATDTTQYVTSSTVLAVNDNTPPVITAFLVNCGAQAKNSSVGGPVQIPSPRVVCFTVTSSDPEAPVETYTVVVTQASGTALVSDVGSFGGKTTIDVMLVYSFPRGENFTATVTTRNAVQKQSLPASLVFTVDAKVPAIPPSEIPNITIPVSTYVVTWPSYVCNPCPTGEKLSCIEHDHHRQVAREFEVAKPTTAIPVQYGVRQVSCRYARAESTGELAATTLPAQSLLRTFAAKTMYYAVSGGAVMLGLESVALSPQQATFTCWILNDYFLEHGTNYTVTHDVGTRFHHHWFFGHRVPGSTCASTFFCHIQVRCLNHASGATMDFSSLHTLGFSNYNPAGWAYDASSRITDFKINDGSGLTALTLNLTWTVNNSAALADNMITDATVELSRVFNSVDDVYMTVTLSPAQLRTGKATIVVPDRIDPKWIHFGAPSRYHVRATFKTKAADPAGADKLIVHSSQMVQFLKPTATEWHFSFIQACDDTMPWEQNPARQDTIRLSVDPGEFRAVQILDASDNAVTGQTMRGSAADIIHVPVPWTGHKVTMWRATPERNTTFTATRDLFGSPTMMSFQTILLAYDGLREFVHAFSESTLKKGQTVRFSLEGRKTVASAGNAKVTVRFVCGASNVEHLLRGADSSANATHTYWDLDLLTVVPTLEGIVTDVSGLSSCTVTAKLQAETTYHPGICTPSTAKIETVPTILRFLDAPATIKNTTIGGCGTAAVTATEACMTVDVSTPLKDVQVAVAFNTATKSMDLAALTANAGRVCLDVSGLDTARYSFSATATSASVDGRWSCASVKLSSIDAALFVAPFGGSPTNPSLPKSADAVTSAAAAAQMQSDQNVWSGTNDVCLALPKGMLLQPLETELLATARVHIRAKGDDTAVPALPATAAALPLVGSLTGGGLTGSPARLPFKATAVQSFCVPLGDVLSSLTNGSSIWVDVGLRFPATGLQAVARVRATFITPKGEVSPDARSIAAATVRGDVGPAPHGAPSVSVAVDVNDGESVVVCFAHRFPQRHGVSVQVRLSNTSSWMSVPQVVASSAGADPDSAIDAEPWVRFKVPQTAATDSGCTTITLPAGGPVPRTIEQRSIENGAVSVPVPMALYIDNSKALTAAVQQTTFMFTMASPLDTKCETVAIEKTEEASRKHIAPPHSAVGVFRLATKNGQVRPLQRVFGTVDPTLAGGKWTGSAKVCFNITIAQEILKADAVLLGAAAAVVLDIVAIGSSSRHAAASVRQVIYALPDIAWVRPVLPSVAETNLTLATGTIPTDTSTLDISNPATSLSDAAAVLARGVASAAVAEAVSPAGRAMGALLLRPGTATRPPVHYVSSIGNLYATVDLDWRFGITNFSFCVASLAAAGETECDVTASKTVAVTGATTLLSAATLPNVWSLAKPGVDYVLQYAYNIDGGSRVVVNTERFLISTAADKPRSPRLDTVSVAEWSATAPVCPPAAPMGGPAAGITHAARYLRVCFEEVETVSGEVPVSSYLITLRADPANNAQMGAATVTASNAGTPQYVNNRAYLQSATIKALPHGTTLHVCIKPKNYAGTDDVEVCRKVIIVTELPPAPSPLDGITACTDRTLTAQKALVGVNWCGADLTRNWTVFAVLQFSAQCTITRAAGGTVVTTNVTAAPEAQAVVWTASLVNGDTVACTLCAMSPLGGICATTNGVTVAAAGDAGEVLYPTHEAPSPPAHTAVCSNTMAGAASCRRIIAHNAAEIRMVWAACTAPSGLAIADYRACVIPAEAIGNVVVPAGTAAWCGTFSNTTLTATITDAAALAALSGNRTTLFASITCKATSGVAMRSLTQAQILGSAPPAPTLPTAAVAAASGPSCIAVNASDDTAIDGGQCAMCGSMPAAEITTHLRFVTAPSSIVALVEGRNGAAPTMAVLKAAFLALQNTSTVAALDAWLEGPPVLNVLVPRGSAIDYKDTTVAPAVAREAVALCCADVSAAPCSVTAGGSDVTPTIVASVASVGLVSPNVSQPVRIASPDATGPTRDNGLSTSAAIHGVKVSGATLTVCVPAHSPRTAASGATDGVTYSVWARGGSADAFDVEVALPALSETVAASETRTSLTGCLSWTMDPATRALLDGRNVTFHGRVVDLATGGRLESAAAVEPLQVTISTTPVRLGIVAAAAVSRSSADIQCSASVTARAPPHRVNFTFETVDAAAVTAPARTVSLGDGYYRYEYTSTLLGTALAALFGQAGRSTAEVKCTFHVQQYAADGESDVVSEESGPAAWSAPISAVTFALREASNTSASLPAWMWANASFAGSITALVGSTVTAVESSTVTTTLTADAAVGVEASVCAQRTLASAVPWNGELEVLNATPGLCAVSVSPAMSSATVVQDARVPTFTLMWMVLDAATNTLIPGATQSHTVAVWNVAAASLVVEDPAPTAVGGSGTVTAALRSSTGAVVIVDQTTQLSLTCVAGCTVTGAATKTATAGRATFGITMTATTASLSVAGVGAASDSMPSVNVTGAKTWTIGDATGSAASAAASSSSSDTATAAPTVATSSSGSSASPATTPVPPAAASNSAASSSAASTGGNTPMPTPAPAGTTPAPPGTTPAPAATSSSSAAGTPAPVSTPAPTPFVDDQPPTLAVTRASAATEIAAVTGHVHHLPVRVQYRNSTAVVLPDLSAMTMVGTVSGQGSDTCVNATLVRYAPQDPTASASVQDSTAMDTTDVALLSVRFTAGSTAGSCGFRLSGPVPGNASWQGAVTVAVVPRTIRCSLTHKVHVPGQPAAVQCLEEITAASSAFYEMRAMAAAATSTQNLRSAHCPIIGRCNGAACGTAIAATTAAGNACGLHSIAEVNTNAASGSGTTGDIEIFSAHLPGLRLDNYSASSSSSSSLRLTVNASVATADTTVAVTAGSAATFDRHAFIATTAKKLGVPAAQVVIASVTSVGSGAAQQYSVGVVVLRPDAQTPVPAAEASASLSNGCVQVAGVSLPAHCTASPPESSSSNKGLAIGLGIGIPLLLIAVAGAVAAAVWWFVLRNKDGDDQAASDGGVPPKKVAAGEEEPAIAEAPKHSPREPSNDGSAVVEPVEKEPHAPEQAEAPESEVNLFSSPGDSSAVPVSATSGVLSPGEAAPAQPLAV